MAKTLASGQGYTPDTTDEAIIAHFIVKYGYPPCDPGLWTRTPTAIIVPIGEESPITPLRKDGEG